MKPQSPVIMPNNRIPKVPSIARTAAKDVGKSADDDSKIQNMMKQLKSARNMK
jgi:hypothetical protein